MKSAIVITIYSDKFFFKISDVIGYDGNHDLWIDETSSKDLFSTTACNTAKKFIALLK